MICKIITHSSDRHGAQYSVQLGHRTYEVRVQDRLGAEEECVVRIDGLERESDLFQSIERVVLADWLGIDAVG